MDCDRCRIRNCATDRLIKEELQSLIKIWRIDFVKPKHIAAARNALLQDCPDFKHSPKTKH